MKTISIRKSIPASTLASSPVTINVTVPGQVLRGVFGIQSKAETSTVYAGFRILSNGRQIFPSVGSGQIAPEDLFAPLPYMGMKADLFEVLDGPPSNLSIQVFNLDSAAILASLVLYTEGKSEKRQVEKVIPSDNQNHGQ